jgi:uncharacterized damage-inducible protein DinB
MTLDDIQFLYAYTEWANERMLRSLEPVQGEVFAKALGGSFPSIRDTVSHIASAEWIWLQRFKGDSPRSAPDWAAAPALDLLRRKFADVHRERAAFLGSLADGDLERALEFRRLNGEAFSLPLGHVLQHVANHSTYHRGQVATLLRQVGAAPVSTDLLLFERQT